MVPLIGLLRRWRVSAFAAVTRCENAAAFADQSHSEFARGECVNVTVQMGILPGMAGCALKMCMRETLNSANTRLDAPEVSVIQDWKEKS